MSADAAGIIGWTASVAMGQRGEDDRRDAAEVSDHTGGWLWEDGVLPIVEALEGVLEAFAALQLLWCGVQKLDAWVGLL